MISVSVGAPIAAGIVAAILTGGYRRYALRQSLLDMPNERSSHAEPTPRGGGTAIVLSMLAALPALAMTGWIDWPTAIALMGGGLIAALIGFADDRSHIPPYWRLLGHFVASAWILGWLGGAPAVQLSAHVVVDLHWAGWVLASLYLVWLLNLTNFMDGIDGIASVEVITVAIGGATLQVMKAPSNGSWLAPVVLAATTLGFLVWNWPPARIFLGDVGSGFLGVTLGALSLQAATVNPVLLWCWIILLGAFVVDATTTLARRALSGQAIHEAHRTHAYQHAVVRWGGHRPVTLAVGAINVAWLFPIALLVSRGSLNGPIGVAVAYAPLVALVLWLDAGRPTAAGRHARP